jgi:adenylate cyclase
VLFLRVGAKAPSFTRGGTLARFSYEFPFHAQEKVPEELIMIYVDEAVKKRLGQPTDQPLDRRFHTQLLSHLATERARLVLYDLVFDAPAAEPATDEQFAEAIRRHGRVVLVAAELTQRQANFPVAQVLTPVPMLAAGAAGYGLANVDEDKSDQNVRRIYGGTETLPSASWLAAELLGAPVTRNPSQRSKERWLNYYCSPVQLRAVNLDQALEEKGLAPGYFANKIVIIGAKTQASAVGAENDLFGNPWSSFGDPHLSPGAVIHAFSLLNLLRGDWLIRLTFREELLITVVWGILISILLMRLPPWYAVGAAVAGAVLFTLGAVSLHLWRHVWFAWAIPVAAQTPVALVWGVGYQYLVESRKRRRLRRAFAAYLSPTMVDEIAESDFDLALGGKEVEATIMFTDLQGFTALSETLAPTEVSRLLTSYFNRTTRTILDQDGTVLKYIGDAVLAVWGAPLPDPHPAERAVLAALGLKEIGGQEIEGRRLRTRIGINTGIVLAGNLGSDFKFDYTLIGDPINVASRLESLNKFLGTDILISESTCAQLGRRIQIRLLGRFLLAGKSAPIGVAEVLGLDSGPEAMPQWVAVFSAGLEFFRQGDFDRAEAKFRQVPELREGKDGPSEFFLAQIQTTRKELRPNRAWDGIVRLEAK